MSTFGFEYFLNSRWPGSAYVRAAPSNFPGELTTTVRLRDKPWNNRNGSCASSTAKGLAHVVEVDGHVAASAAGRGLACEHRGMGGRRKGECRRARCRGGRRRRRGRGRSGHG